MIFEHIGLAILGSIHKALSITMLRKTWGAWLKLLKKKSSRTDVYCMPSDGSIGMDENRQKGLFSATAHAITLSKFLATNTTNLLF